MHLVVTSPPYWTLKEYRQTAGQLGHIGDYERFLGELDKAWAECARSVGSRRTNLLYRRGRLYSASKAAGTTSCRCTPIFKFARAFDLDCLTPILWHKIANGAMEAKGNGAGFYGKPFQPGAIVKNDIEYILFLRKGGQYRSVSPIQKALSMLT